MVEKLTNLALEIISLFRTNYLARFHVREMAKLLSRSHVALLPHLEFLESKNILISKRVGSSKFFSLNLDSHVAHTHMVMAELDVSSQYFQNNFLIKKLVQELFSFNLSGTVILFGSYAKGSFDEQSDIDVLYVGSLSEKVLNSIKQIGTVYGRVINIKTTTVKGFETGLRKKDPLLVEILKYHILLQQSEQFVNFLWRYFDEKR